jgi:hypothetical protein
MKMLLKFINLFLGNLIKSAASLSVVILIAGFSVMVVTSLWKRGLTGKIILVIIGGYLVVTSLIAAYFKIKTIKLSLEKENT